MTQIDYKARVKAGAEWLDSKAFGWAGKVDLSILGMSSAHECILGQVFGDYISPGFWVAVERFNLTGNDTEVLGFDADANDLHAYENRHPAGLDDHDGVNPYDTLFDLWADEVRARR